MGNSTAFSFYRDVSEFIDRIVEQNPQAKVADGFDACIIGIAERYGAEPVLAYSRNRCIEKLMKDGLEHDEANEFFDVNVLGAYVGEGTPIFVDMEL